MSTSIIESELTVSAAEANRGFSRLLREVREGASYVVTAHGRPVAKLTPYVLEQTPTSRAAALEALREHLRTVRPMEPGVTWTRDELHDDI